ncbi:membrane protein insertase YidC [bacterium]|nr:membrane protein insertase YidC [bacterium]
MADKRLFFTLYLIFTIWAVWMLFTVEPPKKKPADPAAVEEKADETPDDPPKDSATENPGEIDPNNAVADAGTPAVASPEVELRDGLTLGSNQTGADAPYYLEAKLTNRGAAVRDLYLNRYVGEDRRDRMHLLSLNESAEPSYLMEFAGDRSLRSKNWEVIEESPEKITFKTTARKGTLGVTKQFLLDEGAKATKLVVEVTNKSEKPVENVHYRMTGGVGIPLEGKWYTRYYRNASFFQRSAGSSSGTLTEETAAEIVRKHDEEMTQVSFTQTPVQFFGVTSQYFASLILQPFDIANKPDSNQILEASAAYVSQDPKSREMSNAGVEWRSKTFSLAPGETLRHEYLLYNGPKEEKVLDEFAEYHLRDVIHYPPFIFIPVSFFSQVLTGTLEFFYSILGDYGLAIILLTIVVRICLFPLNWWQTHSMANMQAVAPLMEKIRREVGDDMQEYSRRTRELYAKYKVNPYAGCLPALIQLPIMVGLWQGLATDFHLRQAPFLFGTTWIQDLSAPDMLAPWPIRIGFVESLLGPYFNLLPIISLVQLILVMMMNMPKSTSPEAKLQKQVMIGMMIMMSFMFYKVPSGLCIYIITGSLWGMLERKLMPKPKLPETLVELSEQAKQSSQTPAKEETWKKTLDSAKKKPTRS